MNSALEWKLGLRNLLRNRRRSFSIAIALVLSYMGLSLLAGHVFRVERTILARFVYLQYLGHVSIYKKGGVENFDTFPEKYQITDSELAQVEDILKPLASHIEAKGNFLTTPALLSTGPSNTPVVVEGIPPELNEFVYTHPYTRKWTPEVLLGPGEQSLTEVVKKDPMAISIANGVSELINRFGSISEMGPTDRELILAGRSIEGDLNAVNATLALKHDTAIPYVDDVHVVAPLQLVRELMQISGTGHVSLFLKDRGMTQTVADQLTNDFAKRGLSLEAIPFFDERIGSFYVGTISFLFSMMSFFGILIFGASGLIMVNSVTIGVLERAKEIGTLRSLGFTPKRVRGLFVKEAFWLSFFSAVTGIILSEIAILLINAQEIKFEAAGVKGFMNVYLYLPFWFHGVLSWILISISLLASYWAVTKKVKDRIANLLLESGATV